MKSVLISIQPKWVEKIASGEKTIEVRKTAPKCKEPFKCYIYATEAKKWFRSGIILTSNELLWLSNGNIKMCDGFELWADGEDHQCVNSKVIGEFVCDKIIEWQYDKGHQYYVEYPDDCTSYFPYLKCHSEATGLKCSEIENYGKGKPLYGWHISDLKIYDKPKELSEFYKCGAKSFEELSDTEDLCSYCSRTSFCEGRWCDEAYQNYLDVDFALTRAPSNWQYVEEL